jgi:glycine cleavage system aminomethyltransferase T
MDGSSHLPAIPSQTIIKKGDQEAGLLTSIAAPDSNNRCMAMAYIKRAYFAAGTELDCQGRVAVIQS